MSICVSCPTCLKNYTNDDQIYSTQCGHIFHFHCMQQWQSRSRSCPECQTDNPTSHQIYLQLENSAENEQKLYEVKLQLELSKKRISELEQQEQKVEELVEVKSQLELSIKTSSELQQQLEQSGKHFLSMQKQCHEKEDSLREMERTIKYLGIQGEYRSKENLVLKENLALKNATSKPAENVSNTISACQVEIALRERTNILEEKLKQVSQELAKEISNSTDLTIEKMKLLSLLSQYTSGGILVQSKYSSFPQHPQNYNYTQIGRESSQINAKQLVSNGFNIQHTQTRNYPITNEIYGRQNEYENNNELCSVVIRGIAEYETKIPLKYAVLKLAHQMELQFTEDDIENASLLERKYHKRHNIQPEKISIVVKFKTLYLKVKFLSNKEKLKTNPGTKNLIVYEFVNENTNALFHYAKLLKTNGYEFVYCRNNVVFARKHQTSPAVKIKSEKEVDKMIADATAESVEDSTGLLR